MRAITFSTPGGPEVLQLIRDAKSQGRSVTLATASDERYARGVADHLGIFDSIIGSDGSSNRKSQAKLSAIRERCANGCFDYVGDSAADIPLWQAARKAYCVNPGASLLHEGARGLDHPGGLRCPGGDGCKARKRPNSFVTTVALE